MKNVTVIDIETGPQPVDYLQSIKPTFEAPSNYSDEKKIAAYIAEKEAAWHEKAALDATSGQVLCIGLMEGDQFAPIAGDEKSMLENFWVWLERTLSAGNQVVGFCIFHFDLPFLWRRAVINGVKVPGAIRRGRYWAEGLIDIAELWQCGNRDQTISLDGLAKCLGVGQKNGSGADFAKLWETDRVAALEYLKNDLLLTKLCWEKMS